MASAVEAGEAFPMSEQNDDALVMKRKHEDETRSYTNGISAKLGAEKQRDLLEVLQRYVDLDHYEYQKRHANKSSQNNASVFLDHGIDDHSISEPSPKRSKLSNSHPMKSSISSKLKSGSYQTFSTLSNDISRVRDGLVDSIRQSEGEAQNTRPSVDDLKRLQRIRATEECFRELIRREELAAVDEDCMKASKQEQGLPVANDQESIAVKDRTQLETVLTLFGNAPRPRQLFSSLQTDLSRGRETVVKSELSIEEMSLPIGLSATKIQPSTLVKSLSQPTFAESFAPAYSLTQLSPPKAHRRSSTRDNTVLWEHRETGMRGSKRGGYTTQPLTVASWLSYGGANDTLTPREKRKQRDRALSSSAGEQSAASRKAELLADVQKQEEVLFKKAYSSFAPSYDNSRALVDASLKNMVWWHKIGSRRFEGRFALDPLLSDSHRAVPPHLLDFEQEDGDFGRVVEEYEEDDNDAHAQDTLVDSTNVDAVLKRISELIQTLSSHQRLRNSSLSSATTTSRTPVSPSLALSGRSGKPDEPTEEETNVYHDLGREIMYLILQLPPYAVAKLDGDQLADLGVNTSILIKSSSYKGLMEEDQVARHAKQQAAATAASIATLSRSTTTNSPHYNSSARGTPAIGQSANTRYGQLSGYGNTRTPVSATAAQRPSSSSNYATPTAAPRSQYSQPNQYPRAPSSQQSSNQSNGQQYYQQRQNPQATGYTSQYGQGAAQQSMQRPTYANTAQQQLQQQRASSQASTYATSGPHTSSHDTNDVRSAAAMSNGNAALTNGTMNAKYSTEGPASRTGTPVAYNIPPQTTVDGTLQARTTVPLQRASSGTPNPSSQNMAPGPVNGGA